jgi:hypothetical protein
MNEKSVGGAAGNNAVKPYEKPRSYREFLARVKASASDWRDIRTQVREGAQGQESLLPKK